VAAKWEDPVVEEVRQRGRAYTERLGNDIHAIAEDLRKHQREHPERYVSQITVVPGTDNPCRGPSS
jgi:hypothetical protein